MEADGPQAADAQGGSGLPRLEEAEGLSAGASEGGAPAHPSMLHCRPPEPGENLPCCFKPPSLG